jgi:murein DD-endopeptidase MepM/ murein hydrolase activator NlpD
MPFPLPFIPKLSYKTGGRKFGAPRASGRRHAGCDLIAPAGTEIFAVADGIVTEPITIFYNNNVKALVIQHSGFVARYCEIRDAAPGIKRGSQVRAGQVVAYVGQMFHMAMLHFEVYAGAMHGPLTVRANKPFQRRGDLIDPTTLLDRFASRVLQSHEPIEPIASAGAVL